MRSFTLGLIAGGIVIYLGVKTMVAHLRGEKVDRAIDTGVQLATPKNMDEPAMKELLAPDLSKWLK